MVLKVLGFVGLMVVGFFLVPAEKVVSHSAADVARQHAVVLASPYRDEPELKQRSGLRAAVEGRLKWLGLL